MRLFKDYLLEAQADISQAGNIRLKFIGSREGISDELLQLMDQGERDTAANTGTTVYVAINYGGRQEIVQAVNRSLQSGKREITMDDISANVYTVPDCDLVIRPSGEQRLSNFLLWQAAYSEFGTAMCCGRTLRSRIWLKRFTPMRIETVVSAEDKRRKR